MCVWVSIMFPCCRSASLNLQYIGTNPASSMPPPNRDRSRSPCSPPGPPPPYLLQKQDNTLKFRFQIRANQVGPMQGVIKRIAADMIEKSALLQFEATAIDKSSGQRRDITNGELIGAKLIKLEPSQYSEVISSNRVDFRFQ